MKRVAVLFHRIGPYHLARLTAAASFCQIYGVEYSTVDSDYAWEHTPDSPAFQRTVLFHKEAIEEKSALTILRRINAVLNKVRPDVVAIPGWEGSPVYATILWCRIHMIPLIMMSESTAFDFKRTWIKEIIKRQLLKNFSAALVGGIPHQEYLAGLGMCPDKIFTGYDVVDNAHFAYECSEAAKEAQGDRDPSILPFGAKNKYFLASARFIEKKNLTNLLIAYSEYRKLASKDAIWDLVLLGDGPLRGTLIRLASSLGIEGHVSFPGFIQYSELPAYYAYASVFVHASTTEQWGLVVNEAMAGGLPVLVSERCGCAKDLVRNGENGFLFDPADIQALAHLMHQVSKPGFPLQDYGACSRRIISNFGVEAFSKGLEQAVAYSLDHK